jgi:hypothetical protein
MKPRSWHINRAGQRRNHGAGGRDRTDTPLQEQVFETCASTGSATPASGDTYSVTRDRDQEGTILMPTMLTGPPWATRQRPRISRALFGRSSAVEQSAVNRLVVGSNPTARASFFWGLSNAPGRPQAEKQSDAGMPRYREAWRASDRTKLFGHLTMTHPNGKIARRPFHRNNEC